MMCTPYKGWIPANCQEVDGEWYFLMKWKDGSDGWYCCHEGKSFFHPFKGPVVELNKQLNLFKD